MYYGTWRESVALLLNQGGHIRRGRIFHADDMIASIDMHDLAGDTARQRREQEGGALADFVDRHRTAQRRVIFVPLEDVAEVADAGRGKRLDRPGRNRINADVLLAEVGG